MAAPTETIERIIELALDQPITYMRERQEREELAIERDLQREQENAGLLPESVQLGKRAPRKIRREVDATKHMRACDASPDQICTALRRLKEARRELPANYRPSHERD